MAQKVMISQPMKDKTEDEILAQKKKAIEFLEKDGYEVVNTYFSDDWKANDLEDRGVANIPLFFLAKSLEKMAECDAVYFCDGWQDTRGCKLEHAAATNYGLRCICYKNFLLYKKSF